MSKIKVSEVLELKEELVNYYNDINKLFDTDDEFYECDFADRMKLPNEVANRTVLTTGRDMVDTAVDNTDIANARVYTTKKGLTNVADECAEMLRKFCLGLIYMTNTGFSMPPWRSGAKFFWKYGVTHFKDVYAADLWSPKPLQSKSIDFEADKKKWEEETEPILPIIIKALHPRWVMPDPWHDIPEFYLELHKKPKGLMSKQYPNMSFSGTSEDIEYIEYWNKKDKCFLLDGISTFKGKAEVVDHKYGFIPYVTIDSGMGSIDGESDITSRWVGMLRHIYNLLVSESRNYTLADYVLETSALPWGFLEGDNAGDVKEISKAHGRYTPLPPGVKVHDMAPVMPNDGLRVWMSITQDLIASHTASDSMRGLSEKGVRSGADRRLIIAQSGQKFAYAKPAFQHGIARVLSNCAKIYKNVVPGNVRLWNWSNVDSNKIDEVIDRDKLKEPFNIHIEFAAINEEDEFRRHDDLRANIQTGLDTKRSARKKMSDVDPAAMEEEEIRDSVRQALIPVIQQKATEDAGLALQQLRAAENLKNPPPQEIGGMTTSVPQKRPVKGSPTAITQQRLAQQSPINPGQGRGGGGFRR